MSVRSQIVRASLFVIVGRSRLLLFQLLANLFQRLALGRINFWDRHFEVLHSLDNDLGNNQPRIFLVAAGTAYHGLARVLV